MSLYGFDEGFLIYNNNNTIAIKYIERPPDYISIRTIIAESSNKRSKTLPKITGKFPIDNLPNFRTSYNNYSDTFEYHNGEHKIKFSFDKLRKEIVCTYDTMEHRIRVMTDYEKWIENNKGPYTTICVHSKGISYSRPDYIFWGRDDIDIMGNLNRINILIPTSKLKETCVYLKSKKLKFNVL